MKFLTNLFNTFADLKARLDAYYNVTLTEHDVTIRHFDQTQTIQWDDIQRISLVNRVSHTFGTEIWLTLIGTNVRCRLPHGSKGFTRLYKYVSTHYPDFNSYYLANSRACTEDAEFVLWKRKCDNPYLKAC